MVPKYRIFAKGQKQQRKTLRFFSLMKRPRRFSFDCPHAIAIDIGGLTQEQINLLKELEAKGLIPKITWIKSSHNSFDDRMKFALLYLHSDDAKSLGCKMKRGYDYAWIKIALERGPIPERYTEYRYMSMPNFVDYIKSLGFKDIAGSKTLNKFIAKATWIKGENCLSFPRGFLGRLECKRRNGIVSKFLEIMNEV